MELLEQEEVAPPKLRFKAPGGYRSFLLGELCSFSLGRNIKQGEASPEYETPCVRYGELYHMYGEVIDAVVNRTNLDPSELLFSQGNEILLPSAGEDPMDIGNASALTLKDVAIGRTINILRPLRADAYDHRYVAYYIREKLRETIAALAQGVSISNVYNTQLRTLEVKLPTLSEQQKIAAFLGAVDRKIQQLKRKQALLEQYKKGVVQQLFAQELRFKRKDGGEYAEWEEKRLGEIGEIAGGGTPDTDVPEYWNGDIQWFTPTEIKGKYVSKSKRTITKLGLQKSNAVLLPVGTILFTSRATIGEISFALEECATNQGFQSIIVNEHNSSEFVYQWILHHRELFMRKAQGSTFFELSKKEMAEIPIELPSLEEQSRIAGFLMALDAKVAGVAQAVEAAQKWKKGLLQQMFV